MIGLTRKKKINLALIVFWMAFIFYMSNQPAEISNMHSGTLVQIFNYLGIDLNGIFGNFAMTIIRKGAHVTEYFILFLLVYNFLEFKYKNKKLIIVTFVFVVLYACSDEFHQMFVVGRAGRITDVVIDSIGVIIGIIVVKLNEYIKKATLR